MIYKKNSSIASIGISLISDIPILLSERCRPFETSEKDIDVKMMIHTECGEKDFCLEDANKILEEYDFDVYQGKNGVFKVQYDSNKKNNVYWISYSNATCTEYQIYYRESREQLEGINPLQYVVLSEFLIHHDAIILHSSLIDIAGEGIVFTAPSQVGKSTQAKLWETYRNAEILNGDRAIIRREQGAYVAYGSPYAGSSGIYKNRKTQLKAIVVLKQASVNQIRDMKSKEAFLNVLSQISVLHGKKDNVNAHIEWLLQWIGKIPVYLLECRPDEEAVTVLWNKIEENRNERK